MEPCAVSARTFIGGEAKPSVMPPSLDLAVRRSAVSPVAWTAPCAVSRSAVLDAAAEADAPSLERAVSRSPVSLALIEPSAS